MTVKRGHSSVFAPNSFPVVVRIVVRTRSGGLLSAVLQSPRSFLQGETRTKLLQSKCSQSVSVRKRERRHCTAEIVTDWTFAGSAPGPQHRAPPAVTNPISNGACGDGAERRDRATCPSQGARLSPLPTPVAVCWALCFNREPGHWLWRQETGLGVFYFM